MGNFLHGKQRIFLPEFVAATAVDGTKGPGISPGNHDPTAKQTLLFNPVLRLAHRISAPGLVRQRLKQRGIVTIAARQSHRGQPGGAPALAKAVHSGKAGFIFAHDWLR